jgi:bacterioferritin
MTAEGTTGHDTVVELLDRSLGGYWTAYAQHHAHHLLLESWGVRGLAAEYGARIADEPVTITALTNRVLDLESTPVLALGSPTVAADLRSLLVADMELQRTAPAALNAALEVASAAHDATTRILLEGILAAEEVHLSWLRTELELLDRLGEQLYTAARISTTGTTPAA